MGGYFQFFTKNRPQNHQKRAILHTSQANGGLKPPRPPWLRYCLRTIAPTQHSFKQENVGTVATRKQCRRQSNRSEGPPAECGGH